MPCQGVRLPGGGTAIICSTRSRKCKCGRRATLACDWKVKAGTCDRPICAICSTKPAPGKDLCPKHALDWAARQRRKP